MKIKFDIARNEDRCAEFIVEGRDYDECLGKAMDQAHDFNYMNAKVNADVEYRIDDEEVLKEAEPMGYHNLDSQAGCPSQERTNREWIWAAEKMVEYGGSFAKAQGDAFLRADSANRTAIVGAFGKMMEHYLDQWPMPEVRKE